MLVDVYVVRDGGGCGAAEKVLSSVEHPGPITAALLTTLNAIVGTDDEGALTYEDSNGLCLAEAGTPVDSAGYPVKSVARLVDSNGESEPEFVWEVEE